ncbi:hypothetical protein [Neobacillus mesonae]|uniref:Uncharacterized protein n=1 Tax=Neobacillus mesonae TaxID=1193713 RepID=A0A3T0I060_9BACI|nr:hypothetical protein [Neobacillus mesonae]AZU62558.1 hypothetical protein CHR53_15475 [Neobacillus mesonae]
MSDLEFIKNLKKRVREDYDIFHSDKDNRKMLKMDGNDDIPPFTGSTYLYIRSIEEDDGTRPLPPGIVSWLSPDITLIDSNGPLSSSTVSANTEYTVRVVVTNDGDQDCHSATVDLFLSDPSIGFSIAGSKPIGIHNVSIPSRSKIDVDFPFLVTNQDSGHKCLFARVYSFATNDYPGDFDNFNPPDDRHTAQRNLSIVQQGISFKFNIMKAHMQSTKLEVVLTQVKDKLPWLKNYEVYQKEIELGSFSIIDAGNDKISIPRKIDRPSKIIKKLPLLIPKNKETKLEQTAKNRWTYEFKNEINQMKLNIPQLGLKDKEAVPINISVLNPETGKILGGITIVVVQ